ncbi:MAG TPA: recombinase family protein [bacterium]|nr:recombinase family protein [bacterium]
MLTAALYARYSSDRQRPTSIEDQLTLCRQAAGRFGCEILPEHTYSDAEISGAIVDRPGYASLLSAARRRAFDAILVEAQDRLWRDQAEMHDALKRLRFWGVHVFAVTAGTELTTKTGRLLASVMGWKDEAYLEDLREKTHRGLAGQARRGLSAGGRTYGYRTEEVTDRTQVDTHGHQRVLGYRRIIKPEEAEIVQVIFTRYADGWSPRKIAHQLNADGVHPPRGTSWTYTAIYGSPRLGTGILRNPLYTGDNVWNRFRWEHNPETGTRVPRLRDKSEWIMQHDENLRIIPQDIWDHVMRRHREAAATSKRRAHPGGSPHRYLFSGLLVCGPCGARYVMRSGSSYACSFHVNRGAAVCGNALTISRRLLEDRILRAVREQVFTPEAMMFLTQEVEKELREWQKMRQSHPQDRRGLEDKLRQSLAERDNIREAIRRGLLSDLTRQMLEEVDVRVQTLRAQLETPAIESGLPTLHMLPQAVEAHLDHLDRVLRVDVDEARVLLRRLLGEIILRPTSAGLVAELRGNVEGLLSLTGKQALVGTAGSGGRI